MTPSQGPASENPYAPSALTDSTPEVSQETRTTRPNLIYSILCWSGICIVSAAPSYAWGYSTIAHNQHLAMWTGIIIFIAGYVLLDQSPLAQRIKQHPQLHLAMRIAYGTRLGISALFPIGMAIDVLCGLLSTGIVSFFTRQAGPLGLGMDPGPDEQSFAFCLILTLVQGVILNAVIGLYCLIVLGLTLAISSARGRLA